MHHETYILLTVALAAGFGLLAQLLAHRWQIPAIVLLLGLGIVLGPAALGWVRPAELGEGLSVLVKFAVSIILFEGALNLRLRTLRYSLVEVRNLVTIGALIFWGLVALIAYFVAGLPWQIAILFGSLLTVTGPTVVQPLMRRIRVNRNVKTVLEGEAILIDPIGAILAVAVLNVLVLGQTSVTGNGFVEALWAYFGRLIVGGVIGGVSALALAAVLKTPRLVPRELSNLVSLVGVWISFALAEFVISEAGIMASVAMGLVLQRAAIPGERQLRQFKEELTILGISMLFILLAANLDLATVVREGLAGVGAILLIMFVARPIAVFLATWGTKLTLREKLFISWIGPRGIVAASVASLFALALSEEGIADGERLLALTFLAIMMTVTIQGLTASWVARLLNLQSVEGRNALIIGANWLGLKVAAVLKRYGRQVVLIDTNGELIDHARQEGFVAIQGNALEEDVYTGINLQDTEEVSAMTTNSEVNVLATQMAQEALGINRAYPLVTGAQKGLGTRLISETGGKLVFGKPVDVQEWEFKHADCREAVWKAPANWPTTILSDMHLPDGMLPLVRLRARNAELTHTEQTLLAGDQIIFLTHLTEDDVQHVFDVLNSKRKSNGRAVIDRPASV